MSRPKFFIQNAIQDKKYYSGSCNDINETSLCYCSGCTDYPEQLNAGYGFLFTKYIDNAYIEQEFADANSTNRYTRSKINGTWTSWVRQGIEIARTSYSNTTSKANVAGSWQYMIDNAFTPYLESGKYLCILSFAIAGTANGVGTVRPLADGAEISVAHRCSVPIANTLTTSGQIIFYKEFSAGVHNIIPQIYANATNETSSVLLELYKIGEV